ncbi:hypothetical protein [Thioflexithrix psekupsensis]|uniref:Uncharacterized protein n=1 Tax=Thioflexithrix psekupsensis TaxID=1570016 RepID=A0A251XA91_9GAMM|nr:hypothetical protein [Thioflexithrix psekupsensis]OUD14603.1 hypothetical protein TPSD3_09985 [Thioflexithrix psekupsensis]
MRKGELKPILPTVTAGSFRDASIGVRQGRNRLLKRIHRFDNDHAYWGRYGHKGYPMQQLMRSRQQLLHFGLRLPRQMATERCQFC